MDVVVVVEVVVAAGMLLLWALAALGAGLGAVLEVLALPLVLAGLLCLCTCSRSHRYTTMWSTDRQASMPVCGLYTYMRSNVAASRLTNILADMPADIPT